MGLYYNTYLACDRNDKKTWILITGNKIVEPHEEKQGYISRSELERFIKSNKIEGLNNGISDGMMLIETLWTSLDFDPAPEEISICLPIK